MSLTAAFTNATLPILGISVVGYALGRSTGLEVGPVNTLGLYVLVPALAFHSIATTELAGGAVLKLGIGVVAYSLAMMAIAYGVGRLIGESGPILGALLLAAAFPNSGFVGIPLSEFAFGEAGRTTAVLYLTVQNLVVYTLGVYVASSGTSRGGLAAVAEIFRLPLLYAVAAGVVVRVAGLVPAMEGSLMETVGLVGDASIPVMLLVLGVQLADTDVSAVTRSVVPSALKLVAAPLVAVAIVLTLGFQNTTVARVFVLECATPAAITPLILVLEFGGESDPADLSPSEFVSTSVLTSTLASMVTLTVLIAVLRSGVLV